MTLQLPLELHYKRFRFNDDEFFDFCTQNDDLKFERDEEGNIYVMPNTGGKTGRLNAKLIQQFLNWNDIDELGEAFDSSTAFKLPSLAVRSPDVSWISNERWNKLTANEQQKFPPICPDFVIELVSVSDNEEDVKNKMLNEWMKNGCRLGWLINPFNQKVFIYREKQNVQETDFSAPLSGGDVLPNFELNLDFLKT